MSEITTKAYDKVYNILLQFRSLDLSIHDARNQILSIPELAIVDRKAELPCPEMLEFELSPNIPMVSRTGMALEKNLSSIYAKAQQDMLKAGWVEEVRD